MLTFSKKYATFIIDYAWKKYSIAFTLQKNTSYNYKIGHLKPELFLRVNFKKSQNSFVIPTAQAL